MASRNAFINNRILLTTSPSPGRRQLSSSSSRSAAVFITSCNSRDLHVSLAARILGPPATFEASKLKVEFHGEDIDRKPSSHTVPRAYTLTHCDLTANLTLAVSRSISAEQLRRWHTALQCDDVVAEWKEEEGRELSLHVHCYVSGANILQELAAGLRYYIFSKELPLVLKAVIHGDAALFEERPELLEAVVLVHFHSTSSKYNRVECWGPLKDATRRKVVESRFNPPVKRGRSWHISSEAIFNALAALLL